jgi:hypothetical protein
MLAVALSTGAIDVTLAQTSRISDTRHNLSASNTNVQNRASTETEICVFCHTPHSSNTSAPAPLWNRTAESGASYVPYTSTSLDAEYIGGVLGQPGASSKLCLSCHDGTVAVGQVSNAPGSGNLNTEIAMSAGTGSTIGAGAGASTGFTRMLGSDLRNDHPISVTFNSTLANRDGEMRTPPYTSGTTLIVDVRTNKPKLPLDSSSQVQCSTCHEPHYTEPKFLRGKRLQASPALGGDYRDQTDQICLACHTKLGLSWANSAHAKGLAGSTDTAANPANYLYTTTAATLREFPSGTTAATGTAVWQAGCLNCHDTHTVSGAKRLLREGTDGGGSPRVGGNPALENTCYQCHAPNGGGTLTVPAMTATQGVPDIQTEFTTRAIRMPIASPAQAAGSEMHNIGGTPRTPPLASLPINDSYLGSSVNCTTNDSSNKCGADFMEARTLLGADNVANRHVECTDCHNPHRVIKNSRFTGDGVVQRTHRAGGQNTSALDGNVASGVLRGSWGVEPGYPAITAATTWPTPPNSYAVKRGDPGTSTSVAKTQTYLTREYQLCLKCHSDYGFGATPAALGVGANRTAATANSYNSGNADALYTNQAAEFGVLAGETPTTNTHQCEAGNPTSGDTCVPVGASWDTFTTNAATHNHRSWHPVMFPTGRTVTERGGTGRDGNFRNPFQANMGNQTMHCSDCHGHDGTWTQGTGPTLTTVQGPHGSSQNFLLRGSWVPTTNSPGTPGFCGNCHVGNVGTGASGWGSAATSGHNSGEHNKVCGRCHVAVPHGWKNKAFLVNLNCQGAEAGYGTACNDGGSANYRASLTRGPYYVGATLRVRTWQRSSGWTETSCGSPSQSGETWMDGTC